ncbi:MAG: MFS transporter [Promethearchaeota archaeon]|nr:MAG: MFS transporter [Candidatus Lokiarchaeota archaeon]
MNNFAKQFMRLFALDENRFTPDFNDMLKIIILNSLGFFFIGFLIPILARQNMNASGFQVSLLISLQVLGRTLSGVTSGYFTDRLKNRSILILIGSFGRGISYFLIYFSIVINSILTLEIGMFSLGFMAGVFWIPLNTLIAEKSNKENRSQAYGKKNSANAIGQIFGALFGFNLLIIASYFTSSSLILYGSIPIFGIANFIAGIKFFKEIDESIKFEQKNEQSEIEIEYEKETFTKPLVFGIAFLFIVILVSSINSSIAKPFLNIYMIENIESNIQLVTYAYLPAGILATLLAPKVGELIDKLKPAIGITITSSLGALVTWFLINSLNIWIFSILLLFDLMIAIATELILQNLISRISLQHRGKILGIGDFFLASGNVMGPLFGGILWDIIGPKSPFIISIFVELSLIPLYLIVAYILIPNLTENYEKKDNK